MNPTQSNHIRFLCTARVVRPFHDPSHSCHNQHTPETQLTLDLKTPSNPQRPGENDDEDDEVRDRLKSTVSGRNVFVFSTHQTG